MLEFVFPLVAAAAAAAASEAGPPPARGYYGPARMAALADNLARCEWARQQKQDILSRADRWTACDEERLLSLVPPPALPRAGYVHLEGAPVGGAELLNAYYESIILMDSIIYDLWYRIQQEETYRGKTVFVVLSDHGRHTNDFHGFGDKCRGCKKLFFLAIGPGIKKGFVSKRKRTLIDVCRTLGAVLDVPTPLAKGKVMKEILE